MKEMKFGRASEYFAEEEMELFLQIPHISKVVGDIVVHNFDVDGSYGNPLRWVQLIEMKKEVNAYDDMYFEYLADSRHKKEMKFCINSTHPETILALIQTLESVDPTSAKKMLDKYHDAYAASVDAAIVGNKVYAETIKMMSYLNEAGLKVSDLNINTKLLNSLPESELDLEITRLQELYPAPPDIKGYNDLDYYPYLFDDIYVIEDVSADAMLICKKDGEKLTWYNVDRSSGEDIHHWIGDLLYDKRQLAKANLGLLNDFNLAVEFDGEKLTKASIDVEYINLLQGYIVSTLTKKVKIVP